MTAMLWQYSAIQAVPSDWSSEPPVGRGALRSKTPILSSPRNPPSNRLFPSLSFRFTHQPKVCISLRNDARRNVRARLPGNSFANMYTYCVVYEFTGGITSQKFHA